MVEPALSRSCNGERFGGLGPRATSAILAAIVALILGGLFGGATHSPNNGRPGHNDRDLYLHIIDDVHHGETYYASAVRSQRYERYPLRPFLTVRPPTLALAMAKLPNAGARRLSIGCLAVVVVVAWAWRLRSLMNRPVSFSAAIFLVGSSAIPAFVAGMYAFHELWSGELIALSLAVYHPRRWPISLAIALLAVSVRELAAPYLLAMGVLAWREGRSREAVGWGLGIAAFLCGLAIHAALLRPLVRADDLTSPGWLAFGGWKFLLATLKWNGMLLIAPDWVIALLAPLALLGLLAAQGRLADRLALVVGGYSFAFMIAGRPDNDYWGLMIAPLWPVGLLNTWPALRGLFGKLVPPRGSATRMNPGSAEFG